MLELKLVEKRKRASGFSQLFLKTSNPVNFIPGQYFTLSCPGQKSKKALPPTNPAGTPVLEFLISPHPSWLYYLKKEGLAFAQGPLGNGWPLLQMEGKDLMLVGANEEFAPLAALVEYLIQKRKKFKNIVVIYKSYPHLFFFQERFKRWRRNLLLHQISALKKKGLYWTGPLSLLLPTLDLDKKNIVVCLAGCPLFYKQTVADLFSFGIDIGDIFIYHSPFKKEEGPIFPYGEIYPAPKIIKIL